MSEPNLTPEEIANHAWMGGISADKINLFLRNATARDIERFISRLPTNDHSHWFHRAKVSLDIRLAEDEAVTADKLIFHTEKLTRQTEIHLEHSKKLTEQTDKLLRESVSLSRLTKVLIWLTVALGIFAVIQIVLMCYDTWRHQ